MQWRSVSNVESSQNICEKKGSEAVNMLIAEYDYDMDINTRG